MNELVHNSTDVSRIKRTNVYKMKARIDKSSLLKKEITWGTGVGIKDLSLFCRQMATILEAGISVQKGLQILKLQTSSKKLQDTIGKVISLLEKGYTFSVSLKFFPKIFPQLLVAMVEAGENGGVLGEIFNSLAAHYEKEYRLREKIKSALLYPGFVVLTALGVISIFMVYILPTMARMFDDLGGTLPLPTRILVSISQAGRQNILWSALIIIILIMIMKTVLKVGKGKILGDKLILKIPYYGELVKKIYTARICRTLSILISNGMPVIKALETVRNLSGNSVISEAIVDGEKSLKEGKGLARSFIEKKIFPPMMVNMIGVGEETGAVGELLKRVAEIYEREIEELINRLTSILEPILILGLSMVVGFLVLAVTLPIFDMITIIN